MYYNCNSQQQINLQQSPDIPAALLPYYVIIDGRSTRSGYTILYPEFTYFSDSGREEKLKFRMTTGKTQSLLAVPFGYMTNMDMSKPINLTMPVYGEYNAYQAEVKLGDVIQYSMDGIKKLSPTII